MSQLGLFEAVAEAVRGLADPSLGDVHARWHGYGVKLWFGAPEPPRCHYEAQVVGARHVPAATALAVEVGFHAELRTGAENAAVLDRLLAAEASWRDVLGPEAVAGPFLGRDDWRRVSETWLDPDLGDPELAIELALRLADYADALEPLLRSS